MARPRHRATSRRQRPQEAVTALERYTALRPKDQDALAELAVAVLALARTYATDYRARRREAALGLARRRPSRRRHDRRSGRRFADPNALQDPIAAAVAAQASADAADALLEVPERAAERRGAYKKLAKLDPEGRHDPVPARPGRAGRGRHDDRDPAYTAFLKLAPNDPLAPQVEEGC